MRNPHDIIIRPIISEKTYGQAEVHNSYTFVVSPKASKPEIADAIEEIFDGVKVSKVNTMNRKGKAKRDRRSGRINKRPNTKRAIITLSEGEIELYSS